MGMRLIKQPPQAAAQEAPVIGQGNVDWNNSLVKTLGTDYFNLSVPEQKQLLKRLLPRYSDMNGAVRE